MEKLELIELAKNNIDKFDEAFFENLISKFSISKKYDLEPWQKKGIELIKITIPYIDNIYHNPNRLIINEEDIVKIELAKKITVESVKHLSRHTNFIQSIDENSNVRPSKILNINKEETFDTYENRVIYTLIKNIKYFMSKVKEKVEKVQIEVDNIDKQIKYVGKSKSNNEEIECTIEIKTIINKEQMKKNIKKEVQKINKIEKDIMILTNYDAYKVIEKKNISLIRPPIKKTNLILKNVNFNYAMGLWDFLQENLSKFDELTNKKDDKNSKMKKIMDEIMLMEYFLLFQEDTEEEKKETKISAKELDKKQSNREKGKERSKKEKIQIDSNILEKQIREIFSNYFKEYENKIANYRKVGMNCENNK